MLSALLVIAGRGAVSAQTAPPRVLTVEDAVAIALSNNRDLRASELNLEAARGQVREAWGSVMPLVDASASWTHNLSVPGSFLPKIFFDPNADPDELVAVKFGSDNQWNLMLTAEQPLFQASAFLGLGAADRYKALQEEAVRGAASMVSTRVRIRYFDVLLAQEGARLNENTVRRIQQSLEETQSMQRAGMVSDYDVLRLQVELANVEPNLRRSRNTAEAAKRALAVELGLTELDSVEVQGSLSEFDFSRPVVSAEQEFQLASWTAAAPKLAQETALELALANRSDLRQAALLEELRRTEVRVEQSEFLPRIALFGNYSINAQNNDMDFFGGSDRFRSYGRQVGVRVTMPVFNGFKRPARLEQKNAALETARTQRNLLRDQVENQVKTIVDEVDEAHERGQAQRLALQQAQRGYEIARAEYREGISSPLELTDAEVALRQSEFNYAQAVYDYLTARARLDEAIGVVPVVDDNGHVALTLGAVVR